MKSGYLNSVRMIILFKSMMSPEIAIGVPYPETLMGPLYDIWKRTVMEEGISQSEIENAVRIHLPVGDEEIKDALEKASVMTEDEFREFYLYWGRVLLLERELGEIIDKIYDPVGTVERLRQLVNDPAFVGGGDIVTGADILDEPIVEPIKFGFRNLDHIGEFSPGELIIIAARPSVGKTAFMLNLALRALDRNENIFQVQIPVSFVSLEMSPRELVERLIMAIEYIDRQTIRQEFKRLRSKRKVLDKLGRFSIYHGSSELDAILSYMRRLNAMGTHVFFIDYVQLITLRQGTGNRNERLSLISRSLKNFARDTNSIVFVGSQLNRESIKEGEEPELHHLRDSGSLEQDADTVIFLIPQHMKIMNLIKVAVKKHRNGALGRVMFEFKKNIQRFSEIKHSSEQKEVTNEDNAIS